MTHPLLSRIVEAGVIATLRAPDESTAISIVDALVKGGITAIEVTYTTPGAGEVIAAVRSRFGTEVVLGAGTVTTEAQVSEAHAAGAEFLVSPGFDAEVVDAIERTGALSMIGAFTATEVQGLAKRGVDVVKFFPGAVAVGAGSELIPAAAVSGRDFDAITDKAQEFLAALGDARRQAG